MLKEYQTILTFQDFGKIDKHQVNIFGAPTAIRALMREGDEYVLKTIDLL